MRQKIPFVIVQATGIQTRQFALPCSGTNRVFFKTASVCTHRRFFLSGAYRRKPLAWLTDRILASGHRAPIYRQLPAIPLSGLMSIDHRCAPSVRIVCPHSPRNHWMICCSTEFHTGPTLNIRQKNRASTAPCIATEPRMADGVWRSVLRSDLKRDKSRTTSARRT